MNVTKEQAYEKIKELVERFSEHVEEYKRGSYNEHQTRVDFIDPFFKALGWDVDNEQGYAEAYREVIHEDKVKVGGSTKAPDYGFTLFGQRKFFVDAKKPSVNIKGDIAPAYQVRRYGWSAKVPISIVTDFEEFSIYDCTKTPKPTDKASVSRIKYLTYDRYLDEFDFLWNVFAKENLPKGRFDKYVQSDTAKKGTATVDDEFLKSIEEWRRYLATTIALRNKSLNEDEINYAVQKIIDRIIFLRMCEDRGVEPYGELKKATEKGDVYENLFRLYRIADDKYNSGLFDFKEDTITPGLTIDNKVLKAIIRELYYPQCEYEFSVMPADILGSVYERFLGKTIRLTKAHHAKIEEKPEVRKAGGVYYTPKYVVDYIVQNTVGKLVEGKTPKQVEKIKICDPACGSGSFLIGAYEYLLKWHYDYYMPEFKRLSEIAGSDTFLKEREKAVRARSKLPLTPDGKLTTAEKKRILLNNIYGVDIDAQAVEVTKLNLLLKALEGETNSSITAQMTYGERVLPNLDKNIKCGNSLIGTDFYDDQMELFPEQMKKINAFDWQQGFPEVFEHGGLPAGASAKAGFDAVIGNPPYDVLEKERKMDYTPHTALRDYVKTIDDYSPALGGKLNLFRFFVVKFVNITKQKGRFGLIIPLSILADKSCASSRKFLFDSATDLLADCFPQKDNLAKRIFKDAKLSTVVITGMHSEPTGINNKKIKVRTFPWNSFDDIHKEAEIQYSELAQIDPNNLPVPLLDSVDWQLLVKLYKTDSIITLAKVPDFHIRRGEINQTIYRAFITDNPKHSRLVKGVEIGQYRVNKKLSQGKQEFFNEQEYLKQNRVKEFTKQIRIATQRITGVDERLRIVATIIKQPAYFADSTNSIHLDPNSKYSINYLLANLNCKLYQWRFKLTSTNNNVGTNELEAMPFRTIDFTDQKQKNIHDQIAKLVDNLLQLNQQLQSATLETRRQQIRRTIDHIERKIDELVYQLYRLTEEEIEIIEKQ